MSDIEESGGVSADEGSFITALYAAVMCGCSYGMTQSITSGIITEEPWKYENDFLKGFIASCVLFGAVVGTTCAGFLSEKFGPKKVLMMAGVDIIIFSIVLAIQKNVALLIIFRTLKGLGLGLINSAAPLYIAEQAPTKRRGALGSVYQFCITIGITIDYILNLAFHYVSNGWRYEFALVVLPNIGIFVGGFFMPESPAWLEKHQKLTPKDEEMQLIAEGGSTETEITNPCVSLGRSIKGIFKALIRSPRALFVGLMIAFAQQMSGINALMNFSPQIMKDAGLTSETQQLVGTIGVGAWNTISTTFAIFLVDSCGRRPLLLIGFGLCVLGHLCVILSEAITAMADKKFILALIGFAIFLLGFELGPGPLFYVLVSELYPAEVRAQAISFIVLTLWIWNIVLVFLYLPMVDAMGLIYTFLLFMIICVVAFFVILFIVPETKGKSLEEISGSMQNDSSNENKSGSGGSSVDNSSS